MAEVATIARPYAEAVFKLADALGALGVWSTMLGELAALADNPEVQQVIGDPNLTDDQLYGVLAAGVPNLTREGQSFLRLAVENRRVAALPEIRGAFEVLKNAREGVIDAAIETAFPLDDAQTAALVADLERRFKRRILPGVTLNHDLIGGVRIVVGDEVIDSSVRGKLATMAAELLKQ